MSAEEQTRQIEDEQWTLIECPECFRSCWIPHTHDCYCGRCKRLMLSIATRNHPPAGVYQEKPL